MESTYFTIAFRIRFDRRDGTFLGEFDGKFLIIWRLMHIFFYILFRIFWNIFISYVDTEIIAICMCVCSHDLISMPSPYVIRSVNLMKKRTCLSFHMPVYYDLLDNHAPIIVHFPLFFFLTFGFSNCFFSICTCT